MYSQQHQVWTIPYGIHAVSAYHRAWGVKFRSTMNMVTTVSSLQHCVLLLLLPAACIAVV